MEASESWVDRGLLPVAMLAHRDPRLGRLFPFTALFFLCFSRSSDHPFTNDCPAIGVDRDGIYRVMATAYPIPFPDGDWPAISGELSDPQEAIAIASRALPPSASIVWIGTAADEPSR
jgi:hypothetical protein